MNYTNETLMAYADGELDPESRAALALAMQTDPALAAKVAQHQALRQAVFGAFAPVLDEPVPTRLRAAAATPASAPSTSAGKVVQLNSARAALAAKRGALAAPAPRRAWPAWGALAASVLVGLVIARGAWQGAAPEPDGARTLAANVLGQNEGRVAGGALAVALTQQLASAPADASGIKIGVSFLARDGNYCRSFLLTTSAGLACQRDGRWAIAVLLDGAVVPGAGNYRQAGSAMPAALLDAIDQRIAGKALDAGAELAASQRGWRR